MEDGGPSQTARRVAAHRLDFTRIPADYGDPAADHALAVDVAAGRQAPASRMHYYLAARTAFFDRTVTGALGRGVTQFVVGAAGYDGRAFRYAKPGVRWFEVDHPATQRDKRERLERLEVATSHITFVAADFAVDDVAAALTEAGLRSAEPSVFLCEGVAIYLERAVLESLLRELREVASEHARLAISLSLSATSAAHSIRRQAFQSAVAAMGEPARTVLRNDEADALLATTRWRLTEPAEAL